MRLRISVAGNPIPVIAPHLVEVVIPVGTDAQGVSDQGTHHRACSTIFMDMDIWSPLFAVCFSQQAVEIERACEHGQSASRQMRPLLAWTIPIQFYTVLIRIAQVKSFAYSVIGRSIESCMRPYHSPKRFSQFGAAGKELPGGKVRSRLVVGKPPRLSHVLRPMWW